MLTTSVTLLLYQVVSARGYARLTIQGITMRENAARKLPIITREADVSIEPIHASSAMRGTPDGSGSPVHAMQARLEQAVMASFCAKQDVATPSTRTARTVALVLGGGVAGWAIVIAGVFLVR